MLSDLPTSGVGATDVRYLTPKVTIILDAMIPLLPSIPEKYEFIRSLIDRYNNGGYEAQYVVNHIVHLLIRQPEFGMKEALDYMKKMISEYPITGSIVRNSVKVVSNIVQ